MFGAKYNIDDSLIETVKHIASKGIGKIKKTSDYAISISINNSSLGKMLQYIKELISKEKEYKKEIDSLKTSLSEQEQRNDILHKENENLSSKYLAESTENSQGKRHMDSLESEIERLKNIVSMLGKGEEKIEEFYDSVRNETKTLKLLLETWELELRVFNGVFKRLRENTYTTKTFPVPTVDFLHKLPVITEGLYSGHNNPSVVLEIGENINLLPILSDEEKAILIEELKKYGFTEDFNFNDIEFVGVGYTEKGCMFAINSKIKTDRVFKCMDKDYLPDIKEKIESYTKIIEEEMNKILS